MANRPFLITVIGILTLLGGLAVLLAGVLLFAMPDSAIADAFKDSGIVDIGNLVDILGVGLIIVGLIFLVVAIGLLKGWTWIWYVAVILYVIDIILGILMLPAGIISLVIAIVIIYYLFRPHVKEFFGV